MTRDDEPRWSVEIRPTRPGDGDWPFRFHAEVLDGNKSHWSNDDARVSSVFMFRASALRWAKRRIRKVERSEDEQEITRLTFDRDEGMRTGRYSA